METYPQSFSIHYVELEGGGGNIVVFEFENGELSFLETEQDSKTLFNQFMRDKALWGMVDGVLNNGKLSVVRLKSVLAKHFGAESLKDLSAFINPSYQHE
jgi:hypothetical protein